MELAELRSWQNLDLPWDRWKSATVRPVVTAKHVLLHAAQNVRNCRDQSMAGDLVTLDALLRPDSEHLWGHTQDELTNCHTCEYSDEDFGQWCEAMSQMGMAAHELHYVEPHLAKLKLADGQTGYWWVEDFRTEALCMLRNRLDVPVHGREGTSWSWARPVAVESLGTWWAESIATWTDVVRAAQSELKSTQDGWDGPLTLVACVDPPSRQAARPGNSWARTAQGVLRRYVASADLAGVACPSLTAPVPLFAVPAHAAADLPDRWHALGPVRDEHSLAVLTTGLAMLIDNAGNRGVDSASVQALVCATEPAQVR